MIRFRITWRRPNKYVLFALFLGAIVAFGAGLGVYTRHRQLQAPTRSFAALNSSLNEVYLQISTLQSFDGSQDNAPQFLASLSGSLKASVETSDKLLGSYKKELGDKYQPLRDAIDTQKQLLDDLQASYQILGKPISYNPSVDIGNLDVNTHTDVLYQRSQTAYDNLFKLADQNESRFSDEANKTLNNSVNCFGELADLAKAKKNDQINAVRSRCINTYPTTRKQLVETLIRPYNGDKSVRSIKSISEVLLVINK